MVYVFVGNDFSVFRCPEFPKDSYGKYLLDIFLGNEDYTCDLTIEEFANYTDRSLATSKRNFKKISELPLQKWIIQKRLEKAYELIAKEHKGINETCFEVGFKNRSHFATAFKRQYGITPSLI